MARPARDGDIIVVTINYRLGVLGFVNFGAVVPGIPSNLGLRDQIAALAWVRDNIAAFGGDPARVTVGGQSAGSMSVSLLLHAPAARGLFAGAIMQSGAVSLIHGRDRSEQVARDYMAALGNPDLAALRGMDLIRLFEAQGAAGGANPGTIPAAPWFDGDLLPASLADAVAEPAARVPLLAGATHEEIRLFELMPGDILPTDWPALEALLHAQLPADHAARILATYPRDKAGRRALATDLTFLMPTRHFADRQSGQAPTWFYRFDYRHPIAGAAHGLDLTLTWPMRGLRAAFARGGPMRGRRAALGRRMTDHIAHFVRHGAPEPDWPAYHVDRPAVKIFDLADRVAVDPDGDRWRAWAGADVGAGLTTRA
ncbi:carboxylesterase family protein [Sphingobium yanoikuyae]|uniref:carboxylesterase family protein n=1 Tax=Sphingobium yanoikuyae TaxID=13690 RepID=UPI0022863F32|nr:carboxylesterase family protein [Sphingobium yanoikuyae]MDG2515558.1 carboxylesterase family protein [Sphingobium yanoikuyae]